MVWASVRYGITNLRDEELICFVVGNSGLFTNVTLAISRSGTLYKKATCYDCQIVVRQLPKIWWNSQIRMNQTPLVYQRSVKSVNNITPFVHGSFDPRVKPTHHPQDFSIGFWSIMKLATVLVIKEAIMTIPISILTLRSISKIVWYEVHEIYENFSSSKNHSVGGYQCSYSLGWDVSEYDPTDLVALIKRFELWLQEDGDASQRT